MYKVLITGGHLTPAVAFIDYYQNLSAKERSCALEFVFAGRQWAQKADGQKSWEQTEISQRGIKFLNFEAVKTGSFDLGNFFHSFLTAKTILQDEKVDLLLSFGGYLALPFALAAADLKIPVITHEQTRVLGRANRLIAASANKLAVSFPQTSQLFRRKTVVTGNPLRPALFARGQKAPSWFSGFDKTLPILYISGGSQGSLTLNQNVLPLLPELTRRFVVVHQVGRAAAHRQPLTEIADFLQTSLGQTVTATNYFPREFLLQEELAYLYPHTTLALARAGANTVAELSAFAIPTLFIPLPFANYHEQDKNAQALVAHGAALVLQQKNLTPPTLLAQLNQLEAEQLFLRKQLQAFLLVHRSATANLYQLVCHTLVSPKLKI